MKTYFIKIILLLTAVWIYIPTLYAQQGDTLSIQRNKKGTVEFVRFKANANSDRKMKNDTVFLKSMLKVRKDDGFRLMNESTDALGITHKRFQQYYKGIKVDNAQYLVHGKNNEIEVANGDFQDIDIKNIKPALTEQQALQKALKYINAEIYKWQIPEEEEWIKTNFGETYYPSGELVITKDQLKTDSTYCLAYKFNIYAHKPLSRNYVYVDANTSDIINIEPLIQFDNANGTADTRYSGTRSIVTDSYTGGFRLRELRNNVRIETYNMQRTGTYSSTDFTNTDNTWSAAKYNNTNMDNVALDAHWGAEMVYEYFRQVHGRNSWDGNGGPILNYVHYGTSIDNASWDGNRMTYGDGATLANPWTSLDVCAHEIAHGVTQSTQANLGHTKEQGALNEGFSDIWAACVKHWAASEKSLWLVFSDIIRAPSYNCVRDMQNPKSSLAAEGFHPDTYGGTYWQNVNSCVPNSDTNDNCYVHNNSTVLSHWFYLLCQGGSGTNDLKNAYSVTGISIDKAQRIVYLAETQYMYSTADYSAARNATISAATDLYGANSQEVISVTNAWYAVGVGNIVYPPPTITGSDMVCIGSATTFSITNMPSNATFSISSNLSVISSSASSISVSGLYAGSGFITMMWNGLPLVQKIFNVGGPIIAGITYDGSKLTVQAVGGNTSITQTEWTIGGNMFSTHDSFLYPSSYNGTYTVSVRAYNSCGWGTTYSTQISFSQFSGYSYTAYPNPASDLLNIEIGEDESAQPAFAPATTGIEATDAPLLITNDEQSKAFDIRLYNEMGVQLRQTTAKKGGKVQFNLSKLPNGNYYLHIYDGVNDKPEMKQIVIKH